MKRYCFGVDIGGTAIKMGMFHVSGELVEKWELPTRKEHQSQNVLPDVAESIRDKLEEKGISKKEILGIGYGVPGIISGWRRCFQSGR